MHGHSSVAKPILQEGFQFLFASVKSQAPDGRGKRQFSNLGTVRELDYGGISK